MTGDFASSVSASARDKIAELELIYKTKAKQVFRLAWCLTGNQADAEDVMQQVFLRLLSKWNAETTIEPLDPFLTRLAICATRDLQRRDRSRRRREEKTSKMRFPEKDPPVNAHEPANKLQDTETFHAVHGALQGLPHKLREPLVLHYMEARSKQDVASLLSVPLSTVCQRLETGLRKLRIKLQNAHATLAAIPPAVLLERAARANLCEVDWSSAWDGIQESLVTEAAKSGKYLALKIGLGAALTLFLAAGILVFALNDSSVVGSEKAMPSPMAHPQVNRTPAIISSTVPKSIALGFPGEAMAFGRGHFWVSVALKPQLVKIDPQSGKEMARLDLSRFIAAPIGGMAWSPEGDLWINDMNAGRLVHVDPDTVQVKRTFELGFNPAGMTWHDDNLYIVNSSRRKNTHICRFDPGTGKVSDRIPINLAGEIQVSAFSLEYMDGGFLLGSSSEGTEYLLKLSMDSGRLILTAKAPAPVRIQGLASDGRDRLWALSREEHSAVMPIDLPAAMRSTLPGHSDGIPE